MEKKGLIAGGTAIHYLHNAALYPQRHGEMIAYALQGLLTSLPAIGTALIWPCLDRNVPWKVYYAGPHPHLLGICRLYLAEFSPGRADNVPELSLALTSECPN